jgi:glucosamine--fructose-6-phosphate aminotransferase (isomerizing)
MCGISAIITLIENIDINTKLLKSLENMQNRGYDSSGIVHVGKNNIVTIHKAVFNNQKTPLETLREIQFDNNCAITIGHNRWATHGEKTVENAHPHQSPNGNIFLVHNGIIENYRKIKNVLQSKTFTSQTDTEVICHLLERTEEKNPELPFSSIIRKAINQLEGTFALIIYHKKYPNTIFSVRRGSPLLIASNDKSVMICSEQSGFSSDYSNYIILENNDIFELTIEEDEIVMKNSVVYEKHRLTQDVFRTTPAPFPHWTLREIHDQPTSISSALSFGARIRDETVHLGGLDMCVEHIKRLDHMIILGCGTSFHSALIFQYFLKKYCYFTSVSVFDGADFQTHDIPKTGKSGVVLISQSGETRDLYKGLQVCKSNDMLSIGVVNVVDSLIAREVDCGMYCYAGREVGVASTKAFSSQIICLLLMTLWLCQNGKGDKKIIPIILQNLTSLQNDFIKTIMETKSQITNILPEICKFQNIFILGKDLDHYVAMESSLKIKEISYIHSEAYSSSALKHGPFALLDESMPVFLLHTNKNYEAKILSCHEEISSRGSPIYVITPFEDFDKPNKILIPHNEIFSFLLAVVPLQLLAYHLSIAKGINPDTPRNLAKVVTVE